MSGGPGHNIVPFGRSEAEKLANLERALHDAEAAAAKLRHPSAPPAGTPAGWRPKWRSQYPSSAEERRANILAAKPRCKVCERPFGRSVHPPPDLVCMDCRRDMRDKGPPETDPALF